MSSLIDIDKDLFAQAFTKPSEWFSQFGEAWECGPDKELLIHQDNGKRLLVVAHLDTVTPYYAPPTKGLKLKRPKWAKKAKTQEQAIDVAIKQKNKLAKTLTGPVVDDRLGCALALGVSAWADVLWTDGEEQGRSTARYFDAPRDYNFIIGFDRRGTDVVTYQYQDLDWINALKTSFNVGQGTFSDIAVMDKLGVSAMNMGIGYYDEHTMKAYWNPQDTALQMRRLHGFLKEYGGVEFSYTPKTVKTSQNFGNYHINPAWYSY